MGKIINRIYRIIAVKRWSWKKKEYGKRAIAYLLQKPEAKMKALKLYVCVVAVAFGIWVIYLAVNGVGESIQSINTSSAAATPSAYQENMSAPMQAMFGTVQTVLSLLPLFVVISVILVISAFIRPLM